MKRAQNKIVESRYLLLVTIVACTAIMTVEVLVAGGSWVSATLMLISTVCMARLSNANSFIRIYSQIVPCAFIVGLVAAGAAMFSINVLAALAAFCVFMLILFRTYQRRQCPGTIFYAHVFLGLGCVFYVHLLYLFPIVLLLTATCLQSASIKNIAASILGLATPYWFMFCWFCFRDTVSAVDEMTAFFSPLLSGERLFDYSSVTAVQMATVLFFVVFAVIGALHFLTVTYKDKIKTRMILYFFIMFSVFTLIAMVLAPIHYEMLVALLAFCTAPLTGHLFALTATRTTNALFFMAIFFSLILAIVNLWMPSLIYL